MTQCLNPLMIHFSISPLTPVRPVQIELSAGPSPFCADFPCRTRANFLLIGSIVYCYTLHMLKGYRHKGIKQFAETGSKAGIQPEHATRLRRLLSALDAATCPANMNAPGYVLHPLNGELAGHWAVRVSGNWRLTFAFEGEDAILVDYKDYH